MNELDGGAEVCREQATENLPGAHAEVLCFRNHPGMRDVVNGQHAPGRAAEIDTWPGARRTDRNDAQRLRTKWP